MSMSLYSLPAWPPTSGIKQKMMAMRNEKIKRIEAKLDLICEKRIPTSN
jgi:hypothetical protein